MPPRTPLTIGVLGTGTMPRKQVATEISDKIAGGRAKFILPVTETHFSAVVKAVAEFARRNEYPYEVIVDDTTDDIDDVDELLDEATKTHKVSKVPRKMVSLIASAGEKGLLALAWDDEDEECGSTLELATEKGLTAYDLTQGLEDIAIDTGDSDEGDEGDDEDEDEAPKVVDSGPIEVTATQDAVEEIRGYVSGTEEPTNEAESDADEAQATLPSTGARQVMFGAAGLLEAFLEEVRRIVREEVTEATKPRPRGRPRKDGQPAGSGR